MKLIDHRLYKDGHAVTYKQTPNFEGELEPKFLIYHYTVLLGMPTITDWFQDPERKASAHFVIGRDGDIVQMADCRQKAWHCGASQWGDLSSLNQWSIGIELECAGKLEWREGRWKSWFDIDIPDHEIIQLAHPNDGIMAAWHTYTEAQLRSALELGQALHNDYHFDDVLGHDQIAPGRKIDPGPAFPLDSFRRRILEG